MVNLALWGVTYGNERSVFKSAVEDIDKVRTITAGQLQQHGCPYCNYGVISNDSLSVLPTWIRCGNSEYCGKSYIVVADGREAPRIRLNGLRPILSDHPRKQFPGLRNCYRDPGQMDLDEIVSELLQLRSKYEHALGRHEAVLGQAERMRKVAEAGTRVRLYALALAASHFRLIAWRREVGRKILDLLDTRDK